MNAPPNFTASQWSNHYRGEKVKLLVAVEALCQELGRPVSSSDLHAYFLRKPDCRPRLLKRLGQQLIAAARPLRRVVPHLHKIGIFHHKAYYALNDSIEWRERFSDYCVEQKLHELLACKIPDHIAFLANGPFQSLAVHAANGWMAEVDTLSQQHRSPSKVRKVVTEELDFVSTHANGEFLLSSPPPLVNRAAATALLAREVAQRREDASSLSARRYLIRFRWPQADFFSAINDYCAWPAQLLYFVRGKWPIGDEDEETHSAVAECLRYGEPPMG